MTDTSERRCNWTLTEGSLIFQTDREQELCIPSHWSSAVMLEGRAAEVNMWRDEQLQRMVTATTNSGPNIKRAT